MAAAKIYEGATVVGKLGRLRYVESPGVGKVRGKNQMGR